MELMTCPYSGEKCESLIRGSGDEGRTVTACRQEYEGNPESAELIRRGEECGSDLRVQNMLPLQPAVETEVQNA